jgi:SAM-dependent methyltransferase
MSRSLPLTVLAWEGPQARAYLVRMRRAGLRPDRVMLIVRDPAAEKRGRPAARPSRRAERAQDRSHNFHPYAIRKRSPELVAAIGDAMAALVEDPMGFYAEMYDGFSYADYASELVRVGANSYRDQELTLALEKSGAEHVLFTGGGIVPAAVFEIPGIRLIHVHTGFLPYVRGADVLLWSLLVRGRIGVSAFLMTPGLDDGDVLAAKELDPIKVALPAGTGNDPDTLYRALFSFIDPLIRAELLVGDVLEATGDLHSLPASPQDLSSGITYHFMHPVVRNRALGELFDVPPLRAAEATPADADPSPARYQKYYERARALAPMRFAIDATRASSSIRTLSIQNRQKDYSVLAGKPELLALHRDMNRQLALQHDQWPSYDYGEGYFYQSSVELGVTGLRDTSARVESFGLKELVKGRTVLEIGCNTGFLTLSIASEAARVVGVELNPYLIAIARAGADFLGVHNARFEVAAFEDFETDEQFDDVLSFANHHTYDGNTRQSLEEYFEGCHTLTRSGGRLLFESHPPEIEGAHFGETVKIIERFYDIERNEIHDYGTFLDKNRRFIVAIRR